MASKRWWGLYHENGELVHVRESDHEPQYREYAVKELTVCKKISREQIADIVNYSIDNIETSFYIADAILSLLEKEWIIPRKRYVMCAAKNDVVEMLP